jgi:hypothetical protein
MRRCRKPPPPPPPPPLKKTGALLLGLRPEDRDLRHLRHIFEEAVAGMLALLIFVGEALHRRAALVDAAALAAYLDADRLAASVMS